MPISFTIHYSLRRIYSVASGMVTFEDLRRHMNADVDAVVATFPEIIDCTGATTSLSAYEIRLLAKERRQIASVQTPAPVAVVANTDLFYGLLRMFEILTGDVRPIAIFRSIDDAEQWIKTQDEEIEVDGFKIF